MNENDDNLNLVSVQSCKGGVGKTTVAALLAAQMAKLGKRVCLVDLDFLAPGTASLFGVEPPDPGIGEFIFGDERRSSVGKCIRAFDICREVPVPWFRDGEVSVWLSAARPDLELAKDAQPYILADTLSGILQARIQRMLSDLRHSQKIDWFVIDVPPSFFGMTEAARGLVFKSRGVLVHVATPSRSDLNGSRLMHQLVVDDDSRSERSDVKSNSERGTNADQQHYSHAFILNRCPESPNRTQSHRSARMITEDVLARGIELRPHSSNSSTSSSDNLPLAKRFLEKFDKVLAIGDCDDLARLSEVRLADQYSRVMIPDDVERQMHELATWIAQRNKAVS